MKLIFLGSVWGTGIPNYNSDDIMTEKELLNFAMQIVFDYELKPNEYEIVASNDNVGQMPNFVIRKDEKLCFIIIKVAIAPEIPVLSDKEKEQIKNHAKKFNAKSYFAPVGFGSEDADRFSMGLALRGDGFYSDFCGLEEIL